MNKIEYRYEKKFSLISSSIEEVQDKYFSNLYHIIEMYPERKVNSIYFDTVDFANYNESISGAKDRIKTRVRWYGLENIVNSNLELKIKKGEVGYKEIYPLEKININKPIKKETFEKIFKKSEL